MSNKKYVIFLVLIFGLISLVLMNLSGCKRPSATTDTPKVSQEFKDKLEDEKPKPIKVVIPTPVVPLKPIAPPSIVISVKEKVKPNPIHIVEKDFLNKGLDLLEHAQKDVGIKEKTGRNDGPRIEQMQKSVGISRGDPYCAAAIFLWHKEVGLVAPRTGWSPELVSKNNVLYANAKPGDVGGLYFSAKKRIAHVFLLKEKKGNFWITTEANTSQNAISGSSTDRDGGGIHNKRRPEATLKNPKNKYSRYWSK